MEYIKNERGRIGLSTSILIFFVCLIIALAVAAFHYWYFPSKYIQFKSYELSQLFGKTKNFSREAKELLNTRNDISYITLLSRDGLREQSYGTQKNSDSKKFVLDGPDDKTVLVGIKNFKNNQIDGYAILWSLIIGSVMSIILLFIIFSRSPKHSMKKLVAAMKKLGEGKLNERLLLSPQIKSNSELLGLYNEFNTMASKIEHTIKNYNINKKLLEGEGEDYVFDLSSAEIIVDPQKSSDNGEKSDPITIIENELVEEILEEGETAKTSNASVFTKKKIENLEKEDVKTNVFKPFKPKIVSSDEGKEVQKRDVTVLVAKIVDFELISNELDSSDLNSFLSSYRSLTTNIISEYGGVVELLLQDEIVAVFNAPKKQDSPELRAVSVAVEIMQTLADLTKKRKQQGKNLISVKIGIDIQPIQFTSEFIIPDKIKEVIESVRLICRDSSNWKIFTSKDFYNSIKQYVEVRKEEVESNSYYSIVAVEEGVVNL